MRAADLTRLANLVALARQADEMRLAGLRNEVGAARARHSALRAALAAPLPADALEEAGGLTAELDWRRHLARQSTAEERRIAELERAAEAARESLRLAFGRERVACRLAEAAHADAARRVERRAEDLPLRRLRSDR